MKKSLLKIVTLALVFFFASAYTVSPNDSRVGYIAPNFTISNDSVTVSLQHQKGKFVLVTFWSSVDASSRIANIEYDRATQKIGMDYIAVNYDRSFNVYREIVKIDQLRENSQFYAQDGKDSKLYSAYRLDRGLKSFLLDPTGKIIAENPSSQELTKLISQ